MKIATKLSPVFLLLASTFLACAQQSGDATQTVAAGNNKGPLQLYVSATTSSGEPVTGLSQNDFQLLDNKSVVSPLSFRAVTGLNAEPPTEVILLVDAVNAAYTTVAYERDQLQRYLKQNDGQLPLPTSLIVFEDENTRVQTQPTRDGNGLANLLNQSVTGLRAINRSQGYWGAADRLSLSTRTLANLAGYESTRPGRKLLIWVSPGWPLLTGIRTDMTAREEESLFQNIVAMSELLHRAHITLYAVNPLGMADAGSLRLTYYEEFLKGVKKPQQAVPADLSLQVLAVQSGGLVVNSSNDIAGLITSCVRDGLSYYELTYQPQAADGPNDYHSLQVKSDKPGVTVRTRTGYYAQP
ncbi:VWA domain-containing protein [Silvibacterium sp.]|uniref:VWA domain-containing protein n=1 Tax=Silvibacterium sp. TaxID=1964179 RepID=UPI0039E39D03